MDEISLKDFQNRSFRNISRRDFLKLAAVTGGLVAAGCKPNWLETPIPPAAQPATSASTARTRVALAQADSYERILIKRKVQDLVEGVGGPADLVRSGSKVAIKVNLTGGFHFNPPQGFSAPESYITHPEVVRALGELLLDAGARELFIVEALYDQESSAAWGYDQIARELGATIIDLNDPAPYADFVNVSAGPDWYIYRNFWFHPILQEVGTFISAAKMKCHFNCGITLSMKNLVGLVPVTRYRLSEDHWWRSALHGSEGETKERLPRVILDLNRARPIDFALVDGIMTAEGGESPRGSFNPMQPGILSAGTDPVAVDAVVTAAMGFDPLAEPPTPPFLRGDNYLSLACEQGMGTNFLADIEVAGVPLETIVTPFKTASEM